MTHPPPDLLLFFGRFHPLLVHLPIGGLIVAGVLEVLAKNSRFEHAAQNNPLILSLVAASAVVAAGCGWMLSQSGDYNAQLLRWHKWAGLALAAACGLTTLLSLRHHQRAYQCALAGTLVLLVLVSHWGGSMTHGRDFLTRYAPTPLRALWGAERRPPKAIGATSGLMQRHVFADLVQPVLRERCSACHGPDKQKAGLRLDSFAAVQAGSRDGPVVVAGHAAGSRLIQRLLLPLDDDDHMPPAGKPQPTRAEIEFLQWWINSGAPGGIPDTPSPVSETRLPAAPRNRPKPQ